MLQFHRSAFRINISFGKLLHSHKDNRAKYYHGSTHGREALFNTAPKISSLAHVNKVMNQIVRRDLGADLIHARENSNFRGVMYTNFVVYHVPVIVKNDIKGPLRSIRRCCREFPQWKTTDRTIVSHFSRGNHDVHYRDGLCMFRALAIHQLGISKISELECNDAFDEQVENLLGVYVEYKQQLMTDEVCLGAFPTKDLEELDIREHGVSENEISIIEKCFDVNIVLLTKGEEGQAGIYRDSCYRHDADTSKVIYLDLYEDHVSLILNIDGYSGVYMCTKCGRQFGQMGRLKRHQKSNSDCTKFPREKFPGGFFKRKLTVFEEIDNLPIGGIGQYHLDKYYPYLICFDFEAMHEKTDEFDIVDTEIEVEVNNSSTKCKTRFISLHKPISVSICSNVPGFTQPHHIVKSISEKQLVIDMIKYMMEIQTHVSSILKDKFSELFQRLDTYRESLIDKATAVKSKQATHEWDEPELQEVQQYIADFKPSQNRVPRSQHRRRQPARNNTFLSDEAAADNYDSDDEGGEELTQTDVDFLDDCSLEASDSELVEHVSLSPALGASPPPPTASCQAPTQLSETSDPDSDSTRDEEGGVISNRRNTVGSECGKGGCVGVLNSFESEVIKVKNIIGRLSSWCTVLPVLGFNSSSYDMRLIRKHFPEVLSDDAKNGDMANLQVVNGTKGFMVVCNGALRFLDVKNYLAPGTSLKKFLIQSHTDLQKGLFPYEYLTDMSVLADTQLPPPEQWYSKLKGCNELGKSQEDIVANYDKMNAVWQQNNMKTLADIFTMVQ